MSGPLVAPPARALAPHPANRLAAVYTLLAGVFGVAGTALGLSFSPVSALPAVAFAALLLWSARRIRKSVVSVQVVNTAVQHVSRGDLDEAKRLLARVTPAEQRRGVMRRATGILGAMIALDEGRAQDAVVAATSAIEGKTQLFTHGFESSQRASALALRGLAYAALGNSERAHADADAAEASELATPDVIARARLAHALVLARGDDREALREALSRSARIVLERASPRERALFRALRRMARSPKRSVYREAARPQDGPPPSKLASWIGAMAPDALAFVDGEVLADRVDDQPPTSEALSDARALDRAKWMKGKSSHSARRPIAVVVMLWVVLVVMFLTIWQFLTPAPRTHVEPVVEPAVVEGSSIATTLSPLVIGVGFGVAALAFVIARARRLERRFALARRAAAMGEPRSVSELAILGTSNQAMIAAGAQLELARIAIEQGDFGEAVSRCDVGLGRLQSPMLRATASDILLPSLLAESAVATAARGNASEAEAKAAILARDFPTFAWLTALQVRVKLLNAVKREDMSAAVAAARARTAEMPIPFHEDVLADVVLATAGLSSEEDRTRIEAELRDDARVRAWIDVVAPNLRDERPPALRVAAAEAASAVAPSAAPSVAAEDDADAPPVAVLRERA